MNRSHHASSLDAQTLTPGTHLTTARLGYLHHGLYASDGKVLHYGGLHRYLWRRPVEEVSLTQFARGRGVAVVAAGAARFAGAAAVERARSRLGEDRYRLWSNNCEHFVTWALNDAPRSAQVEAWRARLHVARTALASMLKPLALQARTTAAPQLP